MANARLGDMTFIINPSKVEWDFNVRMVETETVGGRVIQVFGTDLGDMVVEGRVANGNAAKGDTEGWEAVERMRVEVERMAEKAADSWSAPPYRFTVPAMDWAFDVHIKSFSSVVHSNEDPSPGFRLGLFIVEDITGRVKRGIQDKYIERLTDGIGWAQSEYNGPTDKEVETMLVEYQGSPGLMYKERMKQAFQAGLGSAGAGGGLPGGFVGAAGLNAYLWALKMQESGGDYTVVNSIGAAGAYQYMPGTWNNYRGYASAHLAPPEVQDERAAMDANAAFTQHGTWRAAASIHYSGQYWPENSSAWDNPKNNPTIRQYVDSVMSRMSQSPVQ